MRVLVCGGRKYHGQARVNEVLDALHKERPITLLIHGGANGADKLGAKWAVSRGVAPKMYAADWDKYGRPAGHRRNAIMLHESQPDLVVAFPGGPGTAGMVRLACRAGVEVRIIDHVAF